VSPVHRTGPGLRTLQRALQHVGAGFSRLIVAVLILAVAAISVHAEDWPQFRGPTGQGHSAERGLPLAWSETRNVVWKTPVAGVG
jgi:hypothetical protein